MTDTTTNESAVREAFRKFITCPMCHSADATLEVDTEPAEPDPRYLRSAPLIRASCPDCGIETGWIDL